MIDAARRIAAEPAPTTPQTSTHLGAYFIDMYRQSATAVDGHPINSVPMGCVDKLCTSPIDRVHAGNLSCLNQTFGALRRMSGSVRSAVIGALLKACSATLVQEGQGGNDCFEPKVINVAN